MKNTVFSKKQDIKSFIETSQQNPYLLQLFIIDVRYLGKEFGFKSEEEAVGTAIHLHEKVYAELV